ncbi:MAG: hypothetical protein Fur0041_12730 [Bacteroidia bacterium]
MRRLTLFILLFFPFAAVYAQYDLLPAGDLTLRMDSIQRFSFRLSGNYTAGSNAMTNKFFNSFYRGAYIDSTLKAQQFDRLVTSNVIGINLHAGLSFSWQNRKVLSVSEYVGVYQRQLILGNITSDAFRLVMDGNRSLAGKTADLGGTRATVWNWNEAVYGLRWRNEKQRIMLAGSISFIACNNYSAFRIDQGQLYTDGLGIFIQGNVQGNLYISDSTAKFLSRPSGYGSSLSFYGEKIFGSKVEQLFYAGINDLGAVQLNEKTVQYTADTSFVYSGIDISNAILNPDNIGALPEAEDFYKKQSAGKITRYLPPFVFAGYRIQPASAFTAGISLNMWIWDMIKPQTQITIGYQAMKDRIFLSTGFSYGGFAAMQIPLMVKYSVKNFTVNAGSANLLAYIASAKTSGQGLFINTSFRF